MRTPAALALLLILPACATTPEPEMIEVWLRYDGHGARANPWVREHFARSMAQCRYEFKQAQAAASPKPYPFTQDAGPYTQGVELIAWASIQGAAPSMIHDCMNASGYYLSAVRVKSEYMQEQLDCDIRAAQGVTTREELERRRAEPCP